MNLEFDEKEYVRLTNELLGYKRRVEQNSEQLWKNKEFQNSWRKTYSEFQKLVELTFEPVPDFEKSLPDYIKKRHQRRFRK
jgi:hypothetical protein